MLQQMRKYAKSWFATLFFGAIMLSFALWGVGDIFRGGVSDTSVAQVGSTKIPYETYQRDYRNLVRNIGLRSGKVLTSDDAQKMGLPDRILQSSLNQAALDLEVDHLGLTVGDAQISSAVKSIPAFAGPLGTFDKQIFLQRLQTLGYTEQSFIESLRNDSARQQVLDAARNGFAVPPQLARAIFAYLNERRAVQYIVIPESAAPSVPSPTDAQLAAYIKQHEDRFSVPDYRALSYATVGPEDVAKEITVTDAQLKQEYDLRKDDPQYAYVIPEKRDVQQLNFRDEASAKSARAKIDAGATFDDVAKSQGIAPIDLGTVAKSELGDRGDAVFALPANGVTQPVKNLTGYALMRVSKITPGVNKTLADMKEDIRKDLLAKLARSKVEDIAAAYTDASNSGLSLAESAKKVGMHIVTVPAVDATGLAPDGAKANVPDDPDFQSLMFHAEIGQEGDTFEGKDGHVYVLKVESETPSRLKSLSAVRGQATAMWTADATQKALAAKADALAAQVNAKHDLAGVASAIGAAVKSSPALERDKASADLPMDLITRIFAAPPGTAVAGATDKGGGYIVARVIGIAHPPAPVGDPNYQRFVQEISAGTAEDIAAAIAMDERVKAGVTIHQKQLDAITGSGEGS